MADERAERRLAAVLAADVAGYSRLMGADEEGTLTRLKAIRKELVDPVIARHRGRIVKTTGDGMLVEFASAVDAVRGADEVQRGMTERSASIPPDQRIEFRIGIHVGDIIIDDNDIFGDGVNIAARLEGIAVPNGICISSSAYEQVRGKIEVEFTDLGEQILKNITRPIRAYSAGVGADALHAVAPQSSTPRLSIVVLPFANIGGDPEQEYFVDGVTESLTTDLSRIRGAFVIARNTAFTFKGKAVDVKQIGRQLNVRYVLEGSVQRGSNRLRVNVQLIDAENGNHVWAERFDKPIADLFEMQDEIVSRLANNLDAELKYAEARRAERKPNPDATDFTFQGWAWTNKGVAAEHLSQGRSFFERALALEPENIEALVGLAAVDTRVGAGIYATDRAAALAAAEATILKVLSIAPDHAIAHVILGGIKVYSNRAAQSISEFERALALDRNLAMAHGLMGGAKYYMGRSAETEAHVQEALRISPRDTLAYWWFMWVGLSKVAHDPAVAALWFRQSIEANRNAPVVHFLLASALALSGSLDEGRSVAREGFADVPGYTIRHSRLTVGSDNPTLLAERERLYEGLRMVGVPEG